MGKYKCVKDFELHVEEYKQCSTILIRVKKDMIFENLGFIDDCVLLIGEVKWADEKPMKFKLNYNIFKDYFKEI